jgi:hypothetical protein
VCWWNDVCGRGQPPRLEGLGIRPVEADTKVDNASNAIPFRSEQQTKVLIAPLPAFS